MVDEYGTRRVIGRGLGEPLRIVELQIAVDLVGGHVMQPHPVPAYRFQDDERPDHVGLQERRRIGQRVIHMGFGREVHHRVRLGDQLGNEVRVGDVALHQPDLVLDGSQRFAAARVGHGVQNRHRVVRVVAHGGVHEIGADEAGATGDQQPHGGNPSAALSSEVSNPVLRPALPVRPPACRRARPAPGSPRDRRRPQDAR